MSSPTHDLRSMVHRPDDWNFGIDGLPLVAEEPRRKSYWLTPLPDRAANEGKPLFLAAIDGDLAECQRLCAEDHAHLQERDENKVSPLIVSLMMGHYEVAKWMIENGDSELLFATDTNGNSALHYTIYLSSLRLTTLLLQRGATAVDKASSEALCNRPIHLAMLSGNVAILDLLLAQGATLKCKVQHGPTPIWSSFSTDAMNTFERAVGLEPSVLGSDISAVLRAGFRCGSTNIVKWLYENRYVTREQLREGVTTGAVSGALDLLRWCSSVGVEFGGLRRDGKTPMDIAASEGHLECLKFFISPEGGSEDPMVYGTNNCNIPLGYAARFGHLHIVKYLKELGVPLDPNNTAIVAPLTFAAFGGHLAIVEYMLQHGANVNVGLSVDYTPLRAACVRGYLEVAQLLVARGAEKVETFKRAAVEACKWSNLSMLEWMKSEGHDFVESDYKGKYPTMGAIRGGKLENLKFLVKLGVPVKRFRSVTPVHYAITAGHLDMVKFLIEECGQTLTPQTQPTFFHHSDEIPDSVKETTLNGMLALGIPLARRNYKDWTPMHSACSKNDLSGAKWFHRVGLSFDRVDNRGLTPFELAAEEGHLQMVNWILQKAPISQHQLNTALKLANDKGHQSVVVRLRNVLAKLSA